MIGVKGWVLSKVVHRLLRAADRTAGRNYVYALEASRLEMRVEATGEALGSLRYALAIEFRGDPRCVGR